MESLGPLQALLGERYRVDRELGRGGFATVYQVWNPRLERAEALKVLVPGHQADEEFPKRFTQEVRLAAALEHPSIVKVYDFGVTGGTYWYSMQLVDGRTLSGELRERGPLREREVAKIAVPLLDALDYSHARGIVHRDIKPENVILDSSRRPFLMDFGIAKSAGSLVKTQTGFLLGTPNYVAPEQAQGKPIDGRADLYALGVTLYRAASGRYPFEAEDPLQAVILRLTQPPRPLSEARPGIDPAFAAIVMRALERQPARRWESARTMREAVEGFLAGRPSETRETVVLLPGRDEPAAAVEAGDAPTDATVLGAAGATSGPVAQASIPTVVRPPLPAPRERRPRPAALVAAALGVVAVVSGAGVTGLVLVRKAREGELLSREPAPHPRPTPDLPTPATPPAATPPAVVAEPTVTGTLAAPTPEPTPTVAPLRVVLRPTLPPEPPVRRAVTRPEPFAPEPPFTGGPPEGCSGVEVRLSFAVDAEGSLVAPRLISPGTPADCSRYVLEALPRWKWRPAVDATGAPVASPRLSAIVQLP